MREWIFRFELLQQNRLAGRLWGHLNISHGVLIYWTPEDDALLGKVRDEEFAFWHEPCFKIDAMRLLLERPYERIAERRKVDDHGAAAS